MNVWKSLKHECIELHSNQTTKEGILNRIAYLASQNSLLKNHSQDDILKLLKAREEISSTGLEKGLAIPHCSFPDLEDFIVGLITTKTPIDFESLDKQKSSVFIFIIGPDAQRNKYIKLLSSIAKSTNNPSVKNLLLKADSPEMIEDIFNAQVEFNETLGDELGKAKITIYIQDEFLFNNLIQLLSSEVNSSIAVFETESASKYFHRMPLFASFWNPQEDNFSRVILAVIDRIAVNSTIRKIKNLIPNLESQSKLLLTVEDITYSIGSIDF